MRAKRPGKPEGSRGRKRDVDVPEHLEGENDEDRPADAVDEARHALAREEAPEARRHEAIARMDRKNEDPVGRGQNAVLRAVGKFRVDELRKERHEEHDEHRVRHLQRDALHEEGEAPDFALDGRAAGDRPMLRAAQSALETHRAHAPVLDAEPDHVGRPHHAQKRIGVGRSAQNEPHARRRNGRHDDGARSRAADRPDRPPKPVADRLHERHQDARSRRRHGHDGGDHEKGIEGKVEHGRD